jgi:hypothetical protein
MKTAGGRLAGAGLAELAIEDLDSGDWPSRGPWLHQLFIVACQLGRERHGPLHAHQVCRQTRPRIDP